MNSRILARAVTAAILAAGVVAVLFPLYWILVTSLKPIEEIFASPPVLWPHALEWANYVKVWTTSSIPRFFLNTVLVVAGALAVILSFAALAAFAVSRYAFRGRGAFLVTLLVGQLMPGSTLIIPLYLLMAKANLVDTHLGLILVYAALGLPAAIWLLVGFMTSIPRELDEAARIDGAGSVTVLARVVLPLAQPGVVATALSIVFWIWQELMVSMTFVTNDSMRMIMAGVLTFKTSRGIRWGELTAAGVMVIVPVLILHLFFSKALVRGLTAGAVKG